MCAGCYRDLQSFDVRLENDFTVNCVSEYDGWIRDRIIEYKNGAAHLARPLAQLLSPLVSPTAVLVAIPTSPAKIRSRRFDTVGLLCAELAKLGNKREVLAALRLVRGVQDQVGLSEKQRSRNLSHAFAGTQSLVQNVVVVDDVITTGATLREAKRALVIAGAPHVSAVVLCGSTKKRYG